MDRIEGIRTPVYEIISPDAVGPREFAVNQIDMKDLYTKDELEKVLSRFDCLHTKFPCSNVKCKFDMVYLPDKECIIINNQNMTNDTVEIDKNGKAVSVGSWHHKVLNENYLDIIEDLKLRLEHEELYNDLENYLTNQLDSLAQLGKSQIH